MKNSKIKSIGNGMLDVAITVAVGTLFGYFQKKVSKVVKAKLVKD